MRREGGVAQIFYADGIGGAAREANLNGQRFTLDSSITEMSTFTCFHCNGVVHVPPRADVNFVGMCRNCMRPICQRCSGKPCEPFERKLQEAEDRSRLMREYGLER